MEYLIRSSKEKKKIDIFQIENNNRKIIATILHDFFLEKVVNLPLGVAIVNEKNETMGFVEAFYPNSEEIKIFDKFGKEISSLSSLDKVKKGKFLGLLKKKVKLRRINKADLTKIKPELKEQGISHALNLGKKQTIFYFEKDDEIAGLLVGLENPLKFLPLIIQERIARQELVKKLLEG